MADEDGGGSGAAEAVKCPECPPEGLPLWMGTFSDLVTLLLTFFVLLLSFAKTETDKYKAAVGSLRKAFGGNTQVMGDVPRPGKSPENSPEIMDSQEPVKPFPIDFLTTEGFLDKHEINRAGDEDLKSMRSLLKKYYLSDNVEIYEMSEGIKVRVKDKVFFDKGSVQIKKVNIKVFERMTNLVRENDWTVFVEGHSYLGERSLDGKDDSIMLSSKRAIVVSRFLMKKGVKADKISTVIYGDSRPAKSFNGDILPNESRRVEFLIRKTDLRTKGHRVEPR